LILKGLNVKHALAGPANGVSGEMIAGVNVNFKAWHEASIPFSHVIASGAPALGALKSCWWRGKKSQPAKIEVSRTKVKTGGSDGV
jgi:hypothetical protein